jgi:hypothetical protein
MVTDSGEPDVSPQLGAATATDYYNCDARMTREAP